jgi:hypothetical protein
VRVVRTAVVQLGNQISVKAQQMMSACDIAFRGNPGNTFSLLLRNRYYERCPLHARHVFLFVMHPPMLVLFIKIKTRHFFSASTTSHPSAPQLSILVSSSFVVVPVHLFLSTMTSIPMVHLLGAP